MEFSDLMCVANNWRKIHYKLHKEQTSLYHMEQNTARVMLMDGVPSLIEYFLQKHKHQNSVGQWVNMIFKFHMSL